MGTHIYDVCEKRTTLHKVFFCQFFSLSWPILHFLITPGWFVIVWPFLSLGWFSLWRDRRQIREKGGGRLIARRCWLSPSTRTAAVVVGRKDGTDPRSADSNTAVNPILRIFLENFLYDRVLADIQTYIWRCMIRDPGWRRGIDRSLSSHARVTSSMFWLLL